MSVKEQEKVLVDLPTCKSCYNLVHWYITDEGEVR